ncbi:MAG: DUF1232 domain-containing protein [Pirellulales bacterium]|nr:DUF1232 domain-containing protein [Pirellulales bacterium]
MERIGNNLPITIGGQNGEGQNVRTEANEYALQNYQPPAANRKSNAIASRKRKRKHSWRHDPVPQPPKAMWPAYLMFAGAVLYFFMPLDAFPELLFGPAGYLDDIALVYGAYRQWKLRKPDNNLPPEFPRSMREPQGSQRYESAERMPPLRPYEPSMREVEEPGFLSRLWKAFMYIIGGGAL